LGKLNDLVERVIIIRLGNSWFLLSAIHLPKRGTTEGSGFGFVINANAVARLKWRCPTVHGPRQRASPLTPCVGGKTYYKFFLLMPTKPRELVIPRPSPWGRPGIRSTDPVERAAQSVDRMTPSRNGIMPQPAVFTRRLNKLLSVLQRNARPSR